MSFSVAFVLFVGQVSGQAGGQAGGPAAAQSSRVPGNLDFHKGSLADWEGTGFVFTPAADGVLAGASSQDAKGKAMVRQQFTVPRDVRQITFQAYSEVHGDNDPGPGVDVVLAGGDNIPVPKLVKTSTGAWSPAPRLLLPHLGKPRLYSWDVSALQGKRAQIVLIDHDERPGHYLWAGGFALQTSSGGAAGGDILDADFGPFMLDLQKKNNLNSMARFDSKHFTALSNAPDNFTTERLQNCEVFYDLFLGHFEGSGFAVHPPKSRMMMAIFDNHEGFDAYFGQKMPTGIAGVYHTLTNRLVLYDYAENRAMVANKNAAIKKGDAINNALAKSRFVDSVNRKLTDVAKDANLSTTMHECAHQISFNCGLLTRGGDVPACIAEGLATYCEATDQGDWTSLGERNPMRIATLSRAGGKYIPLSTLLRSEQWIGTPAVLLGYAQSWSLFHMLMQEQPKDLQKYFKTIASRKTPEHRLLDFQATFGPLEQFEPRYQRYMDAMVKTHRTVR